MNTYSNLPNISSTNNSIKSNLHSNEQLSSYSIRQQNKRKSSEIEDLTSSNQQTTDISISRQLKRPSSEIEISRPSKRPQIELEIEQYGDHENLKEFIYDILNKIAKLREDKIKNLLTDKVMVEFKKVFTTANANPNENYEFYELLGDSSANNCVVWYFQRKFFDNVENINKDKQSGTMNPVAVMSRLKQEGASVRKYSKFSEELGFRKYITYTNHDRINKVLEDVFEAFIGCLVYHCDKIFGIHTGNTTIYPIIEYLFNKENITIDEKSLYDSKSRLNNDITKMQGISFKYVHKENPNFNYEINKNDRFFTKLILIENSNKNVLVETEEIFGPNKPENEKKVANKLLKMSEYEVIKNKFLKKIDFLKNDF